MPHAAFAGAPARINWSAWSKSIRKHECRQTDADEREDDRQWTTATKTEALAAADAEHREHEVDEAR